jgi:hypothetical protein
MIKKTPHSFHIPVMGLGYTIDTPVKVARFGISSVISIIEDELIEQMRKFYCQKYNLEYAPIPDTVLDHRALRITAYLNLVKRLVDKQVSELKNEKFEEGSDITKYFDLLPEGIKLKHAYNDMLKLEDGAVKTFLQEQLRKSIIAGSIDVNIMSKIDLPHYDENGNELPAMYCDAVAAFRGFAESDLSSSVVFSAGYNPRLYSFVENYKDFYPDENGYLKKKIILKVSDYRSALVQGKIFAKKGIWVSEFRIESGLNCGGHAFPTDGILLGPILEEFKNNRENLAFELLELCNNANSTKGNYLFLQKPEMKITVQGGVGTSEEHNFLLEYYGLDSIGWGSPFLLVPEATNVDTETLHELATAKKEDYYLSHASPLGIPFNNFRKSSAEKQRHLRIDKGRPGSPCYKKFLSSDTEFTKEPICTSSRQYQDLKIKQLREKNLPADLYETEFKAITEKDCLCEGLGVSALIKNHLHVPHKLKAVTICPGPNLAYFSGVHTLKEMINHIYGRTSLLNSLPRPHMFTNELYLYIDYLKNSIKKSIDDISVKQAKYFQSFKDNLFAGINYYKTYMQFINTEIAQLERKLVAIEIPKGTTILSVVK